MKIDLTDSERKCLIEYLKCCCSLNGGSDDEDKEIYRKLTAPDRRKEYQKLKKEFE